MTTFDHQAQFQQLAHKIAPQSKLLRAWVLTGGVSAQVTALEIERPDGQTYKRVVRQHGAADLTDNPNIARDEFRLLERLQAAGIPAPKPYYVTAYGEIFDTPCLVVEYIEGMPEFAPADMNDFIRQCTAHLARIHRLQDVDVSFLPDEAARYRDKLRNRPALLDHSLEEGRIRDALERAVPLPQRNSSVLLHGDFWHGNLLWNGGKLVGVIDWEDAKYGDPLSDLAYSRLEMLWTFGDDAMHSFTHEYQAIMPNLDYANLPYWDLYAALRPAFRIAEWAGDPVREREMREKHQQFVAQALEKLVK